LILRPTPENVWYNMVLYPNPRADTVLSVVRRPPYIRRYPLAGTV
jgi:hypothetical protein